MVRKDRQERKEDRVKEVSFDENESLSEEQLPDSEENEADEASTEDEKNSLLCACMSADRRRCLC